MDNSQVATVISGADNINLARLYALRSGLTLETKGLKRSRGPSCQKIVKSEFKWKGSAETLLTLLNEKISQEEKRMGIPQK